MRIYVLVDINGTAFSENGGIAKITQMSAAECQKDIQPTNDLVNHLVVFLNTTRYDTNDFHGTGCSSVVFIPFAKRVDTDYLKIPMELGSIVNIAFKGFKRPGPIIKNALNYLSPDGFALNDAMAIAIQHHLDQNDDHGYRFVFVLPYQLPPQSISPYTPNYVYTKSGYRRHFDYFNFVTPMITSSGYRPELDLMMSDHHSVMASSLVKARFSHRLSTQSSLDDFRDWIAKTRSGRKPISLVDSPPPISASATSIPSGMRPALTPIPPSLGTYREVVKYYLCKRKCFLGTHGISVSDLSSIMRFKEAAAYFDFLNTAYSSKHFGESIEEITETLCNALYQAVDFKKVGTPWTDTNVVPSLLQPPTAAVTVPGLASLSRLISQTAPQQPVDLGVGEWMGGEALSGPLIIQGASRSVLASIIAHDGLGIEILSGLVQLRHLQIDVGQSGIAIRVHPGAQLHTENVLIRGRVEGISGEDGSWALPAQVDLLDIPARIASRHLIPVTFPVPCTVESEIEGVTAALVGPTEIELLLEGERALTVLHGYLTLRSERFVRRILLTGRYSTVDVIRART